jgi:tetratricopeptide (TPR) repeat protein
MTFPRFFSGPLSKFSVLIFFASFPAWADNSGRLLGIDSWVLRDAGTGKYLLVPDLPIVPIDQSRRKEIVVVVDSGIAKDHPQFAGRVVEEIDFTGEGPADELGHGTIVALLWLRSFLDARQGLPQDMRKEISLVSLKVATRNGEISKLAVLKALEWIEKNEPDSANLSLGFKGTLEEHADLCKAVADKRTQFAAAAGNEGPNVSFFPAVCPDVTNVGCLGEDGKPAPNSGKGILYSPCSGRLVTSAELLLEEGMNYARTRNFDAAMAKYEESLRDKPLAETHYQIGVVLLNKDQIGPAGDAFRAAISIYRDFPEALEKLAIVHYLQGNLLKAKSLLQEAIDIPPAEPSTHFILAVVLEDLDELDAALAELDRVANLNPQYPQLDSTRNQILRRKNAK